MNCEVRRDGEKRELFLRLNFGDKMQRELTSELKDGRCSGRYEITFIVCTTCSFNKNLTGENCAPSVGGCY